METMQSRKSEVKVRAPERLVAQLEKEAEAKHMDYSDYVRKKLAGTLQKKEGTSELLKALDDFFKVFQSAAEGERIALIDEEIEKLKQIQEVAKKYV